MTAASRTAVYPGSFDPLTNGHVDIITRGAKLFDRVVVAILVNEGKQPLFSVDERLAIIREVFKGQPAVEAETFEGLLVDYVRAKKASAVVRGLRDVGDFDYERQMALMNRHMLPALDTVFLMPAPEYAFVSSSLVKQIVALDGSVSGLVPPIVEARLAARQAARGVRRA